jgi:hypothetical protein
MSPGARYLLLVVVLVALVWHWPILWEVGLVGILGGAAWWLAQPKPDADTDAEKSEEEGAGES